MPLYCKQLILQTTNHEVLNPSQGYTKSCIEFGRSAALTGWFADGIFLWDIAVVCWIGKKKESEAFEVEHWFQVLKDRSQCGRESYNVLMFVTCSTKYR